MADTKISDLTARTTLASTDDIPVVADGVNYRAALSALMAFLATATTAAGTLTASAAKTLTQTWNNAAVVFTAFKINITDTASDAASLLMDLQVAAASKFKISKAGVVTVYGNIMPSAGNSWLCGSAGGGLEFYSVGTREVSIGDSGGVVNLTKAATNVMNCSGGIQGPEISDPAAPAANNGIAYFRDNGSGKTQYCVRFPTGAVQVLATEP